MVWQQCKDRLQNELPSQQFNTWIRPLEANEQEQVLTLMAPNRFIKDFVSEKFSQRISELVSELEPTGGMDVVLEIATTVGVVAPSATGKVMILPSSLKLAPLPTCAVTKSPSFNVLLPPAPTAGLVMASLLSRLVCRSTVAGAGVPARLDRVKPGTMRIASPMMNTSASHFFSGR